MIALDTRRNGDGVVIVAPPRHAWVLTGGLHPILPWLRTAPLIIAGLTLAPLLEAEGVTVTRYGARQTGQAPAVDHPDPDVAKLLGWCAHAARRRPMIW